MNLLVVFLTLTADADASPQEWGRSFLAFGFGTKQET
jgi:hypothetical protein